MTGVIEVTPEFEGIAIRINGVLHLWFDQTKLLGITSWIMDGRKQFFIEFAMAGGSITVDYDSREKWETILARLDTLLAKERFGT